MECGSHALTLTHNSLVYERGILSVAVGGVACGLDVGAAGDVCGWVLVLGKSGADTR